MGGWLPFIAVGLLAWTWLIDEGHVLLKTEGVLSCFCLTASGCGAHGRPLALSSSRPRSQAVTLFCVLTFIVLEAKFVVSEETADFLLKLWTWIWWWPLSVRAAYSSRRSLSGETLEVLASGVTQTPMRGSSRRDGQRSSSFMGDVGNTAQFEHDVAAAGAPVVMAMALEMPYELEDATSSWRSQGSGQSFPQQLQQQQQSEQQQQQQQSDRARQFSSAADVATTRRGSGGHTPARE